MALSSSKFKFFLVVSCTILQMPKGSEAVPMFNENRYQCGKPSVRDAISPGNHTARELPWVVIVRADVGYETRFCTGTILTPRLVLTSKNCAPKESKNVCYSIDLRHDRHTPVSKVHNIEGTPFMALEVSSPPFRSAFAICLPFDMTTGGVNNTVSSVTSVIRASSYSTVDPGKLYQEEWLLTKPCEHKCDPHTDRCTCAICSVNSNICAEDEGKPVTQWIDNRWYLVGMVTNVNLEKGKCKKVDHGERLFQWLTDGDALKIGKLIATNVSYYLPDIKPTTDSQLERPDCGQAKDHHLGSQKELAPSSLPWVVAVHATANNQTVNCTGAIIDSQIVLTAAECIPKGFENATIEIVYNSIDFSTGPKIAVANIRRPKDIGLSFILLQLVSPVDESKVICMELFSFDRPKGHVVAASWAFKDIGSRFAHGMLYYEKWTLPDNPGLCDGEPFNNTGVEDQTNICGVSGTDTDYACQGDLGAPVMYWNEDQWHLVGMVTHVDVGKEDCGVRKNRKRVFEWINGNCLFRPTRISP